MVTPLDLPTDTKEDTDTDTSFTTRRSVMARVSKDSALPVEAKETDATTILKGFALQEGVNTVHELEDDTLVLQVVAAPGKLLEYRVIEMNGCPVDETVGIRVTSKKKTTCWQCGTDAQGNRHCWKVPCPVIVGPWKVGAVIVDGFTLG